LSNLAIEALQQFGDEAVLALADASSDRDEYVRDMALEVLIHWDGNTEPHCKSIFSTFQSVE